MSVEAHEEVAETRAAAQRLVMAGLVFSGDKRLEKAGQSVGADTALEVRGQPHPYVSRGGLKLERALDHFAIPVAGRTALDHRDELLGAHVRRRADRAGAHDITGRPDHIRNDCRRRDR